MPRRDRKSVRAKVEGQQRRQSDKHTASTKLYMRCDAFILYNDDDKKSTDFVSSTLKPLLLQSTRSVMTTKDFIPGVSYKHNFNSALAESILIFVICTSKLFDNPTCDSNVAIAIAYNNSNWKKKLIPILLEKCEDPSLAAITGIPYDRSKDNCNEMLAEDLERAYKFHGDHLQSTSHSASRESSYSSGVTSRTSLGINKEEISTNSRKLQGHNVSPDTTSESAPSTDSNVNASRSPKQFRLNLHGPFQTLEYLHGRAYVIKYIGIIPAIVYVPLTFFIYLSDCDSHDTIPLEVIQIHLGHFLLLALLLIIVPYHLFLYLTKIGAEEEDAILLLCEPTIKQIRKFLNAEGQMKHDVRNPRSIFKKLKQFLQSVARVNLITAWLYSLCTCAILWMVGHFDLRIENRLEHYWIALYKILNAAAVIIVQGCARTLIGIHQYERNLLVDAHRMVHDARLINSDVNLKVAQMLRERSFSRANKAFEFIVFLAIGILAVSITTLTSTSSPVLDICYCLPTLWIIFSEALINCPKRHMKLIAVAINLIILACLIYAFNHFNLNNYQQMVEPPNFFLHGVTLRMLCLSAALQWLLHILTWFRIKNWPLPDPNFGKQWKTLAMTIVALPILLTLSLLPLH